MKEPILRRLEQAPLTLIVRGGLHYIAGNSAPYFSLTADEYENGRWASGGCQHDLILQHFPELADLAAMHLSDLDGAPMHAEANAWYWLAGTFPDAFGERYHAGNSTPAKSPVECLAVFAKHCRIGEDEAREIQESVRRVTMAAPHSRNAVARATCAELVRAMRPRWKTEAEACIKKHALVIFGDKWEPANEPV
jgi:hypothetical protein